MFGFKSCPKDVFQSRKEKVCVGFVLGKRLFWTTRAADAVSQFEPIHEQTVETAVKLQLLFWAASCEGKVYMTSYYVQGTKCTYYME